jgi:hypothetical protein
MNYREAMDISPTPDEITVLAADLVARATRLADACKDLAADRAPDPDAHALTEAFTAEFEGEDG